MYEYAARVVSVHDGDTITVDLDLGFHIWVRQNVRLLGIDAPELVPRTGRRVALKEGEDSTRGLLGILGSRASGCRTAPTFGIPGDYVYSAGREPEVVLRTRINRDPDLDKYGRILAEVWVGTTFWRGAVSPTSEDVSVNERMVAEGYAKKYGAADA